MWLELSSNLLGSWHDLEFPDFDLPVFTCPTAELQVYICASTHGSRLILYVTTQSESRKYITLLNFKKLLGEARRKTVKHLWWVAL